MGYTSYDATSALEELIRNLADYADDDNISAAIEKASKALGYNPLKQEYRVYLEMECLISSNPEDAVLKFHQRLRDNPMVKWNYTVIDESGEETEVPALGWLP